MLRKVFWTCFKRHTLDRNLWQTSGNKQSSVRHDRLAKAKGYWNFVLRKVVMALYEVRSITCSRLWHIRNMMKKLRYTHWNHIFLRNENISNLWPVAGFLPEYMSCCWYIQATLTTLKSILYLWYYWEQTPGWKLCNHADTCNYSVIRNHSNCYIKISSSPSNFPLL